MPIGRAWIGCAALYLAALTARPALAAPRWLCAQSPHFELYSSSDRDSVARLGGALETMAEILGQAGLGRRTAARPVTVIIGFPDKNSFTPHLPVIDGRRASFAGYVIHNPYGNWIGYGEYDERGRMVAQHEYVHTIVNQVFRHLPLTLNEGFADYLSTFRAEPSLAEFGHPIPWYRAAIQEMSLRPLDEMFEIDAAALHKLSGDEQSLFYAESWAFVHYLLRADATGGRFTQFMRAAAEGGPIRSAFARYYPDETWDKIPSRLKGYVETDVFTVHQIPLGELARPAIDIRAASNAEVQTEIGLWRLFEAGLDTAVTRQIFESALAQGAADGVARAGLGELSRLVDRPEAALGHFRDVARDESAAPRALTISGAGMLLIGLARSEAVDEGILTEARAVLARSVARDSLDATALGWFGRASLVTDQVDAAAISALQKATTANPGDEALASAYSVALARTGQAGEAREAAEGSQALKRDRETRHITLEAIEQLALRDSVQSLLEARRPAAAAELVDRLIAGTGDGRKRAELLSLRAEILSAVTLDSAIDEYNAGVEAARQHLDADARAHFIAAQSLAVDDPLRAKAGRAIARLDSLQADGRAEAAFQRAARAWRAGDYGGAKARFDSMKVLAASPEVRSAAQDGSDNAAAMLEIERGLGAVRKSAWADAIAAFQRASGRARSPEIKTRAEQLLAETKKQAAGTAGARAGHK